MAKREILLDIKVIQSEAQKRLAELVIELQKQRKELADLNKAYQQGLISEKQFGEASVTLRASIKQLSAEQRTLEKTSQDTEDVLNDQSDSLVSLRKQLSLLTKQYDNLSAAERDTTEEGKALQKQIDDLTKEILGLEEATGRSQRNVGNYKSAFDGLSSTFGGVVSSIAGAGGLVLAVGSIGDAISDGIKYVGDITEEFRTLRGEVQQLTGAVGEPLDELVVKVKAVSETFGKDFKEVLIASNAVAKQFGITQQESLDLIQKGFLAGADASGKFLDQLTEYPAQLKSVGLSAEDTIAIITQQVQEGIFSDKGIDAIKEAGLRLREFTPATAAALDGIGLSSEAIQKALADGSKTLFDVVQEVSQRLNELPENTKEVGAAIADIFGGPGEDAGLAYLKTLKDVRGGIDSLIDPTNELTQVQIKQQDAAEQLAAAQNELSKIFSENQTEMQLLSKEAQIFALEALLGIINAIQPVIDDLREMGAALQKTAENLGLVSEEGEKTNIIFTLISKAVSLSLVPFNALVNLVKQVSSGFNFLYENVNIFRGGVDLAGKAVDKVVFIFDNFKAILYGTKEAITEVFSAFNIRPLEIFAINAQIQFLKIKDAIGFGDAIGEQIAKLEAEKANIEKAGVSISEAFRKGFNSVEKPKAEVKTDNIVENAGKTGTESGKAFADGFTKEVTNVAPSVGVVDNSAALKAQAEAFKQQQEEILRARIANIQLQLLEVEKGSKRELELKQQLLDETAALTLQSGQKLAEEELLLLAQTEQQKRDLTAQFVNERLKISVESLKPFRDKLQQESLLEREAEAQRLVDAQANAVELINIDEEVKNRRIANAEEVARAERDLAEEKKDIQQETLQQTANAFGVVSEFAKKRISVDEQVAEKQKELAQATTDVERDRINQEIAGIRESGEVKREETIASKALSIAEATINTYLAATKALASLPPPASFIAAGVSIATGLLNVAKIAGVSFAEGGETGIEGISDPKNPGRKIVGVVHDNEYVVPTNVMKSKQGKPLVEQLEKLRNTVPSFAVGGFTTLPPSDFGTRQDITNVQNSISVGDDILAAIAQIKPVVSVTDINKTQNRVSVKEKYGSI